MMQIKEQTYISPKMEVVYIEVEQSVLDASTEDLGLRNNDLNW